MMRPAILLGTATLGLGVGAVWWVTLATADADMPVMPETVDIAQGAALYAENCASCHGADREGQPNWRTGAPDGPLPAPPHDETGHTWHHPDSMLFRYTQLGGGAALALEGVEFDSGMPGFGDRLSDAEIWNILAYIKSTWPERQRALQAERTRQALGGADS